MQDLNFHCTPCWTDLKIEMHSYEKSYTPSKPLKTKLWNKMHIHDNKTKISTDRNNFSFSSYNKYPFIKELLTFKV
jgi:hypothetical protein